MYNKRCPVILTLGGKPDPILETKPFTDQAKPIGGVDTILIIVILSIKDLQTKHRDFFITIGQNLQIRNFVNSYLRGENGGVAQGSEMLDAMESTMLCEVGVALEREVDD